MKDGICGENKTKPNLFPKTNRGSTNLWVFVRILKIRGCVYHILPFQYEYDRFKSCRNILILRNFFHWLQQLAQIWDLAGCVRYVPAVAKDWFVLWSKDMPYLFFLSFNLLPQTFLKHKCKMYLPLSLVTTLWPSPLLPWCCSAAQQAPLSPSVEWLTPRLGVCFSHNSLCNVPFEHLSKNIICLKRKAWYSASKAWRWFGSSSLFTLSPRFYRQRSTICVS